MHIFNFSYSFKIIINLNTNWLFLQIQREDQVPAGGQPTGERFFKKVIPQHDGVEPVFLRGVFVTQIILPCHERPDQ